MRNSLLILTVLAGSAAFAGPLLFTLSGTYGPSAVTAAYVAPNEPFTLSFEIQNPPVANASLTIFEVAAFDVVYTLNGVPIPVTNGTAGFAKQNNFFFCLDLLCDAEIITAGTAPAFTGTLFTPTLVPGIYPQTQVFSRTDFVGDNGSQTVSSIDVQQVSTTPEPATVPLAAGAFVGLFVGRKASSSLRRPLRPSGRT